MTTYQDPTYKTADELHIKEDERQKLIDVVPKLLELAIADEKANHKFVSDRAFAMNNWKKCICGHAGIDYTCYSWSLRELFIPQSDRFEHWDNLKADKAATRVVSFLSTGSSA
jgi:hypothetical protein